MKLETSNPTAGKQAEHAIHWDGNAHHHDAFMHSVIEMHLQYDCRTTLAVQIFLKLRLFRCLVWLAVKPAPALIVSRRDRADSVCYTERRSSIGVENP